jgi:hypothetical protein
MSNITSLGEFKNKKNANQSEVKKEESIAEVKKEALLDASNENIGDPWWFMRTPFDTVIGLKEKEMINHIAQSGISLPVLISFLEKDHNVKLFDVMVELGYIKID